MTTSVKSVFDCDLGCFVDKVISEEVTTEAQIVTTTTITKPSHDNVLVTDVLTTETSVTKSHTEQIKPKTQQPTKHSQDESENLLIPLVSNDPTSEISFDETIVSTSEPKEV